MNDIIWPVMVLASWTALVLLLVAVSRIHAVRRRRVSPRYFRTNTGEAPEYLVRIEHNYNNLLQLPVLFYVLGAMMLTLKISDPVILALAWLFVVLRMVHTVIHIGYNNILHRLGVFALGLAVLIAMWVRFAGHVAGSA